MFGSFCLSSTTELTFWEQLAEWYHGSLIYELLNYLKETYFTVKFGEYENFSIGETAASTIESMIPALAIALVIAAIMTARVRINQGRFVRRLLKNDCLSPASAKSLLELDLFRNGAIRRELLRGTNLRMVVRCVHADGTETGVGILLDQVYSAQAAAEEPVADAPAQEGGEAVLVDSAAESATLSEPVCNENASTGCQNRNKRARRIDFTTARFYIPEDLKHRADVRFDRAGSGWAPAIASIVLVIVLAALLCWLLPHVLGLADAIISLMAPS